LAPEPARGTARDSLFRIDQARTDTVAARGLADGLLAFFAADVAYLRAGAPPVFGRDGARVLLNATRATDGLVAWEPLGGGVSNDLRSGYTYGVTARAVTPPRIRAERYIAFWERAPGRPWTIVAYAEIGAPPLPNGDAGLSTAQTTPVPRSLPKALAEARASVRAADSAFSDLAYRMGTGYAFSNTVADDGVLFGSPALLIGPKAVRESYEARGTSTSLTWRPIFAATAESRDLGYTIGESVSTGRGPSGAVVQRFGKYLTVWRRQKDGTWRFVIDGGNDSPARP
jgi:ketosteroid isomerase-like protein